MGLFLYKRSIRTNGHLLEVGKPTTTLVTSDINWRKATVEEISLLNKALSYPKVVELPSFQALENYTNFLMKKYSIKHTKRRHRESNILQAHNNLYNTFDMLGLSGNGFEQLLESASRKEMKHFNDFRAILKYDKLHEFYSEIAAPSQTLEEVMKEV
ncbi:hypothetical protein ACFO26_01710 [Lactococcus nasutitermitis]|uniref:Uncharacterized protein n=1 Tax=Lactococcus nasutitermitis TaxID=1652957 RepID=A0ABV9JB16_9LACT|nr:hypothetical protein [Lactococcus nasutitermitis]